MTKYRDCGTIYKSYIMPIEIMETYKEKYFYLKSVLELSLYGEIVSENIEKNLMEFDNFSEKILKDLEKNKHKLAKSSLLNLIPNAKNCYKKYLNGTKGKCFGKLGGAPKENQNARKNNPKTTPDIEEEETELDIEKRKQSFDTEEESSKEFLKFKRYGNNGNVVLSEININCLADYLYKNISQYLIIEDEDTTHILRILINELDKNIEKGKEPKYNASNPTMHYQRLKTYLKQKLKEENRQSFIDTLTNVISAKPL